MEKPSAKPNNPNFSSGPCSKRPGWSLDALKDTPIGRSHRAKECKDKLNEVSSERLDVLCQTQDGFKIAEKDLEIRGPGEIMGAQQTGIVPFKYANLIRDSRYLEETKLIAEKIFNEDRQLANKLIKRWVSGSMAYADA